MFAGFAISTQMTSVPSSGRQLTSWLKSPNPSSARGTETRTGEAKQVTMTVDGGHSANPASVVITADRTIAVGVDNRFDKPLPATGGSSALVLGVSGFGIAGLIVGIVLLTRRRRREI